MAQNDFTRAVTIKDVARVAEVSPSVVSRVLNGDASLRIRDETRERILGVIETTGYRANSAARSLRLSRTHVFGLVTHDHSNPIYAEILAGAFEACSAAGYSMIMADADELNRDLKGFDALLRGHQVDGVLLLRSTVTSDEELARLAAASVPTVLLMDSPHPGVSTVSIDDEGSSRRGVQHLLDLGHRRIAHLTGLQAWRSDRRHQGYLAAMRTAGIEPDPSWVEVGGWTAAEGHEGMHRLLTDPEHEANRPTAVFVSNSMAALGALGAARSLGINVPGDLSVASLHDTWLADITAPTLTTVRTPLNEMGRRAVNLLVAQQTDRAEVNDVVSTDPEIVRRESSAPPPN